MAVLVEGLTTEHETKLGAHAISGVSGLQTELGRKFSPSNKPEITDVTGLGSSLSEKYSPSNKPSANDVGAEPAGAVAAAISSHEAKLSVHPISGVAGLRAELDALAGASGGISAINDRLVVVEGKVATLEQRKYTCLVNATGTGAPHETVATQLPANITINSRYVLPNPFGNTTPVICWAEVFTNGKWSRTGFIFTTASSGASASYVQGEGIVVQTGTANVTTPAIVGGGGHGGSSYITTAPCRVFVRKLEA